jgi:microcystin-dependent protein
MADPFIGEIKMFGGNFAIRGWAFCDGQLLSISQNDALFALFGTTYGGDGQTTFGLPDLRGRIPVHQGGSFVLGQVTGTETVTLTDRQHPVHTHLMSAFTSGSTNNPTNARLAGTAAGNELYTPSNPAPAQMASNSILPSSGNQPHNNMMPYQVISFLVALEGIFPSQN